ncbi:acyl-CoA-binding domain-containing protein 6-like [Cucurbita maxima]|uniref:Acyl-CoA-binding domain-containing protein 6-like n=1 Tax=Cucurbita maxima TaxID=3661 RepID=A0A6J1IRK4_CUCMA|nr:acyl-CoA-binding domain-containing protein 6-like [Cucurbita maxima]XP_022979722.1 acyl-CoA-binding domain-containing protein 6-like [Cucurbita maxima]
MKMFGFRRRMKNGRLKVQLSDPAQGTRSPIRHPKRVSSSNSECAAAPASRHSEEHDGQRASDVVPDISNGASGQSENWMVLSMTGEKPAPRFNHAATVIGNKMIVVGGESGNGLLDDVQVLDFDKFTWSRASSKLYLSPSSLPLKIPACKGHGLVSWGKKALLVGGKTEPGNERVAVWAFDTLTECWSLMEAKGDIPVARSGHTVVRASSVLILFGGEDSRRRKLNDLHMFDLKSFTWLPLHCTGTSPSARSNHVAALYDDKTLLIFGGTSKSRTLNDLYSLDFETMVWSRIKVRGFHPSPRAGSCGVLCGTKWCIAGGGSKKKRHAETLIFDVLKLEWSVAVISPPSSVTANKGFSLVLVQHKEKDFLLAFGGSKKEPSNQVEVLTMEKKEPSLRDRSNPIDSTARQNLASAIEHGSGRKSISESSLIDTNSIPGNISLRKQIHNDEAFDKTTKIAKTQEDDSSTSQVTENKLTQSGGEFHVDTLPSVYEYESSNPFKEGVGYHPIDNTDLFSENSGKIVASSTFSSIYQFYEAKMAALIRKNGVLEGQLAAAMASREAVEKNLSSALKIRQEMEKRIADMIKEMEMLRDKLAGVEIAKEEANSLSNIVHSDNVRLEHDVAFLKAVLDDTQKELHSTRGVLAGERSRAFQLQVEVFHLKQRLQSMENRAPTPRKPFHM